MKDRAGRGTQPGTRCCLQCHTAALGTQCCAMGQGSPGMQQKAVAVGRRSPAPQSSHPTPHRARQPLLSCVWANLSFFFHYPGMYCHLIFMYAILPDKYDLLSGNSSDVHSAPCSNYGSHPRRSGPVVHLSDGSWCGWTPLYASPMLANARVREMRWLHLHSPALDSWVSGQQQARAGCRGNGAALSTQLSLACAAIPHGYWHKRLHHAKTRIRSFPAATQPMCLANGRKTNKEAQLQACNTFSDCKHTPFACKDWVWWSAHPHIAHTASRSAPCCPAALCIPPVLRMLTVRRGRGPRIPISSHLLLSSSQQWRAVLVTATGRETGCTWLPGPNLFLLM